MKKIILLAAPTICLLGATPAFAQCETVANLNFSGQSSTSNPFAGVADELFENVVCEKVTAEIKDDATLGQIHVIIEQRMPALPAPEAQSVIIDVFPRVFASILPVS